MNALRHVCLSQLSMTCSVALLLFSGATFSAPEVNVRTSINVNVGDFTTGCSMHVNELITVWRWRTFKAGVQQKSKRGSWGPSAHVSCPNIGITEAVRTQAGYIMFDYILVAYNFGMWYCMPVTEACP